MGPAEPVDIRRRPSCLAMSILTPARPGFPARLPGIVSGTNLEDRYCTNG